MLVAEGCSGWDGGMAGREVENVAKIAGRAVREGFLADPFFLSSQLSPQDQ